VCFVRLNVGKGCSCVFFFFFADAVENVRCIKNCSRRFVLNFILWISCAVFEIQATKKMVRQILEKKSESICEFIEEFGDSIFL
jgi:hypothetical protein